MAPPRRYLGTITSVQPAKRQVRIALRKGYKDAAQKLKSMELELRDGESMQCRLQTVKCDNENAHVVFVAGVTRDNVARMRGAQVVAPEGSEPDRGSEFELEALLAFEVIEDAGAILGTVTGVLETLAGGILRIETNDGRRLMLPAIPEAIAGIDWDAERIVVNDIEPYAVENDEG